MIASTAPALERRSGTPPLCDDAVWELHLAYHRDRDPAQLGQLVAAYRRYAISLARRMHRQGEPLDDLIQVACEALVQALQRFDPDRGVRFPAFAAPTIIGALKRYYRDLGWSVRVPRRVHELVKPARDTADALSAQLGRGATTAEVAEALDVPEDALVFALEAAASRTPRSLTPVEPGDGVPEEIGGPDRRYGWAEDRMTLVQAFSTLREDERELVELYFFRELSQSAIAGRLGVSQMQVSRLLAAVVAKLRASMSSA